MRPCMRAVTARQQEILTYLRQVIEANGFAPSLREIADHFHMTVKGASDHIKVLERKGMLTRREFTARSIQLIEKDSM